MSKGCWSRLFRWFFGPPIPIITIQPVKVTRSSAARAATPAPQPGKRPQEKPELEVLFFYLPEKELDELLRHLASILAPYTAWTAEEVPQDPWRQLLLWSVPLVIPHSERLSMKQKCALIQVEVGNALRTYNTPASVLSQPVRVAWLQQHAQRIETVYRLLEQHPGQEQHAASWLRWAIFCL